LIIQVEIDGEYFGFKLEASDWQGTGRDWCLLFLSEFKQKIKKYRGKSRIRRYDDKKRYWKVLKGANDIYLEIVKDLARECHIQFQVVRTSDIP